MSEEVIDPWSAHVSRFDIRDAQLTGMRPDGEVFVRHDLSLTVQEGRFEHLSEDEQGQPTPSRLCYGCTIRISGAASPDYWSGTDMQIVVTGTHQNGWRITIVGQGAIGFDDAGSVGIEFDQAPTMTVYEKEGGDG
ncbi:MAG: hypothetical protein GW855_14270 [Erythrobacter sp.]|nr:hypothetical protein [Erythrobacter sp.]NCQ64020.1 hypothetical protein [Alphaproteobacteria bacterium]